jgi:hypothetical protein
MTLGGRGGYQLSSCDHEFLCLRATRIFVDDSCDVEYVIYKNMYALVAT